MKTFATHPATFECCVPEYQEISAPLVFSSCLCCSHHFRMPLYSYWCKAIGQSPIFHRKQWEFVYICQALFERNLLNDGKTAIGFAVGKEPLPALFASRGVKVLASDLEKQEALKLGWVSSNQHSDSKSDLNKHGICDPEKFERLVSFRNLDMNKIPSDLGYFDFCWSACAFEHLGSIRKGIDFVLNSCKLLKPGGLAIHTTEFNLSSNDTTFDNNPGCVIYRKRDIEILERELMRDRYSIETIDYYSGYDPLDKYIDNPPYTTSEPHLRLLLSDYAATSIGIIIHKPKYITY